MQGEVKSEGHRTIQVLPLVKFFQVFFFIQLLLREGKQVWEIEGQTPTPGVYMASVCPLPSLGLDCQKFTSLCSCQTVHVLSPHSLPACCRSDWPTYISHPLSTWLSMHVISLCLCVLSL